LIFDIALAVGLAFGDRLVPHRHTSKGHSHAKDAIRISAMEFAEMPGVILGGFIMPGWACYTFWLDLAIILPTGY
jgi:hypothetical protein